MQRKQKAQGAPTKVHFKMYKDGKRWVVAGMFSIIAGTFMFAGPNATHAATDAEQAPVTVQANAPTMQFDAATSVSADAKTDATATAEPKADEKSATVSDADSQADAATPAADTDAPAPTDTAQSVAKTALKVTATFTQSDLGMTTISGQTTAGATVSAVDAGGSQIGRATTAADGTYSIKTRITGKITLTATKDGATAGYTSVNLPAATQAQKDAAKSGKAELVAKVRDAIVDVDIAKNTKTQLDTNDVAVEKITPSNIELGAEFTNLNDVVDQLDTAGKGESASNPISYLTTDDTFDVNVVTNSSSLVSANLIGTDGQYDVIQLGDGLQGQIRMIDGKAFAVVTTEFTKSIGDIVPFYDLGQSILDLFPGGDIVSDAMQAVEDATTITTTVPVVGVESSKTADGDYTKFVVDLSQVDLAALVANKIDAAMEANESGSITDADRTTIANATAEEFGSGFSASFLGETTVVTPLTVRPTADITQTTKQQDIAIASAFYDSNVFQFTFGDDEDTYMHPLYVVTPDKDGNGIPDLTDDRNSKTTDDGGTSTTNPGTTTTTDLGGNTGGDTNTTPTRSDLAAKATIDGATSDVIISGSGATPGNLVYVVPGTGYTDAEAALTGTDFLAIDDTIGADGTFNVTIDKDKAEAAGIYGTDVTVVDAGSAQLVATPVDALALTGDIAGNITVEWRATAQKPSVLDHAGDELWAEVEDYYANTANPRLAVTIFNGKTARATIELTDTSMFTWEPHGTYNSVRAHDDEFILTQAGIDYVNAQVKGQFPNYTFDAATMSNGGTLTIETAKTTITLSGSATVDQAAANFDDAALKAIDGQLTAQVLHGQEKVGNIVVLTAGTDYQVSDKVQPQLGTYANAFTLTDAGIIKVQATLDESHELADTDAVVNGGSLSVTQDSDVHYTVTYSGAGTLTPDDNPQTVVWHGVKDASGQETWTAQTSIKAVDSPRIAGFMPSVAKAFANAPTTATSLPGDQTVAVTYTLSNLSLNALIPDGKYVPISGQTAPNMAVTITTANGEPITTNADDNGDYDVIVTTEDAPIKSTVKVSVTVEGKTQNKTGVVVANVPDAPTATISPILSKVSTITGTAEPNATITINDEDGHQVATGVANATGQYTATVSVTDAPPHTTLLVTQTTAGGTSLGRPVETFREVLNSPTVEIAIEAPVMNFDIG